MTINFEDRYIVDDDFYAYNAEILVDDDGVPYVSFLVSNGDFVKQCILRNDYICEKLLSLNRMVHIEGTFEGTNLIIRQCTPIKTTDISLEKFFGNNIPADIKLLFVLEFLDSLGTESAKLMHSILEDYKAALKLTYVPMKSAYDIEARREIIDNIFEQVVFWMETLQDHMDIVKIDIFFSALIALKLADFFMLNSHPVSWQSARYEKIKNEILYWGKKTDTNEQVVNDIVFTIELCKGLTNEEIEKKLFKANKLNCQSDD